jgi:gliding motility-associated-like protein
MKKIVSIVLSLMISGIVYSQCVIMPFTATSDTLNCGDSLSVQFVVYADLVLTEAFTNGGPADTNWISTSGAIYTNPYIPSPTNDPYFWMGTSPIVPTALTSAGFDVSGGGQVCFDFVYAVQGQPSPTEGPDQYDEGITVQYSIDGGLTWIDIVYYAPNGDTLLSNPGVTAPNVSAGPSNFNAWTSVCIDIPLAAMTANTSFQWIQEEHSSPNNDHWGLDNITIATADPTYSIYNLNNGDSLGPAPVTHTSWVYADTIFNYMYTAGAADTCYGSMNAFMNPTDLGPDLVLDCNNNVVQLVASGVSLADNYFWTPTTYLSNPTGLTTYASPIDTTDYIFSSSCGTDTITINVVSNYLFSTSGDTTICIGDSAPLAVFGGAQSYAWTPNNGTISDATIANPIVTPLATTNYIVVTDSAGCLKTDTFTVTVSNKNFVLALITDADCGGSNSGQIISPAGGAVGPFEYYFDNGSSIDTTLSPSFGSLFSGTYTITYSDSMYCDIDTTVVVGGGFSVSIDTILFVNPLCVGATNGSIEVFIDATSIDSNSIVNYSLNGGITQINPVFNGLTDGTYLVSAQVGTCPADTQTIILSAPATVEISFVDSTDLTCGGSGDGEIQVSATNGVMPYQFSIDNVNFFNNVGIIDSLAAGTYTVYVMDNNGCGDSLITSISEPAPVTIVNVVNVNPGCFNDSTGSITFDAINGTLAYLYSIDSGLNFVATNSFPSLWDDSYTLMAQDANGCISALVYDTLVEPTQLVLVEDSTQSSTCGASDGIVYVSGSGGTLNYTFNIDGGLFQPLGTFNGLSAGLHTIILQDFNGCSETIDVMVIDNGAPTLTIVSADSVSCFGLTDATVQLSATGGLAPYQFSVNGSPLSPDSLFMNLGGGLHTFIVVDGIGCNGSTDTVIFEPSVLDVTASQDSVSCFGLSDGNITLFPSAGTAPYLYAIDDTSAAQVFPVFSNYLEGTYMGYVMDVNGCIDSVSQTVSQADSLIINNIVADSVVCHSAADGLISFDAIAGVSPYTYSINGGTLYGPLNSFTVDTGSFDLIVQDAMGCNSAIYPVTVYQPTDVVLDSINTANANCGLSNGSLEVLASGGVGSYTYVLNGVVIQVNNGLFNNVAFGTQTVVVTDNNGCTETINVFVDQNTNLALAILSSDSVSCGGAGDATVIVQGSGGISPYYYTLNGGAQQNSPNFTNLSGGMNVFSFTDSIGNCIILDSVDIFEPIIINVTATQNSVTCDEGTNGEINLTATGGNLPYSYAINNIGTTQTSSDFLGLSAGSNVTYVIDDNGCVDSVVQVVLQADTLETTTVAVDISCMASGSITVNPTGGTMPYFYSLNGGLQQTTNVFTIATGGNYTVSVTDANGCTPAAATDSIIAPTPVIYTVDFITSNLLCNGNTDGVIGIAASGGSGPYTYSIGGGPFQTDSFFNNLSAGTYSINVRDMFLCESTLTTHVIAEPTILTSNINTTTVSCFGLADGTIFINNVSGGVGPYVLLINGSSYNYSAGLVVGGLNAGSYNVFIEDANLCNTTVIVTIADVTPINVILGTTANVSCYGVLDGEIEVSATGGVPIYTFELFTASSSTTITNISTAIFSGLAGTEVGLTYPILVTDANGCTDSLTHTVMQPVNLIIDSLSSSPETCFGYSDGIIATHVSGGSAPYAYSWAPTGYANVVADGLTSGVHTVTVTDANGCSVFASETLPAIDPVLADITPDSASISMGDTLQLGVTVQNAIGANLQYSWSPITGLSCTDCQNPFVTVYNDISYSVVVTDENGCMSYNQTEVVISVDASLFFFIPNGFTPNGDGINDNFQVYGQDVKTVDMMVFNRWGEKVFQGNNQFQPWDGTYKGVAQSAGAFTYVIDVTFLNDAEVQKKGSVSLIR